MIQLHHLEPCTLCSRDKARQPNGSILETITDIADYQIQVQELYDEVSASIYGADLNKTVRVCSPHNELEGYLMDKVNFSEDNVTNYAIKKGGFVYEILSVKKHWIDMRVMCETSKIGPSA